MLTVEERRIIRSRLPQGSGKEIAEIANVSRISVSNWFAGKNNSEYIEDNVVKYAVKQEEKRKNRLRALGLL